MADLENEIRLSSDFAAYTANRHGLPSLETFIKFVAKRICETDGENPTTSSIRVERESKHSFKIDGTATIRDRDTLDQVRVAGEQLVGWIRERLS